MLHMYRICSIRRHGYYLFHRTILCGFYSRAAFIKLRVLIKIFVIVRALRKASYIRLMKNCDVVAWFWSKPFSLISRRFATKRYLHGTSDPFPCFLPTILHDEAKLLWTVCVLVRISFMLIWYYHSRHKVCSRCACATPTLAMASIWERRLFRSAHLEVRQQFKSSN